jgi:predicted DNA-binding transcriptional regulator AlpA
MEENKFDTDQSLRNLIKESVKEALSEMGNISSQTEELLSLKQVAHHFDVSLVTIHKWRKTGLLPGSIKQGGKVFFKKSEVFKLVESKKLEN